MKMKINKPLIEKMIKRIEAKPRGYNQDAMYAEPDVRAPCGTVACLAGEAAICSKRTEAAGLELAHDGGYDPFKLMGIPSIYPIFGVRGGGWPEPYRSQYPKARTYKARAKIAANFLRAIVETDGAILDTIDQRNAD